MIHQSTALVYGLHRLPALVLRMMNAVRADQQIHPPRRRSQTTSVHFLVVVAVVLAVVKCDGVTVSAQTEEMVMCFLVGYQHFHTLICFLDVVEVAASQLLVE
jgi:hypothetical protein